MTSVIVNIYSLYNEKQDIYFSSILSEDCIKFTIFEYHLNPIATFTKDILF